MSRKFKYFRVCPVVVIIFFLCLFCPAPNDLTRLSPKVRRSYFQKAQIWHPTDIAATMIQAGPESGTSLPPEAEVPCYYVEEKLQVGASPKFKCRLMDSGEIVRIKFSRRETYAEVAGTRLLWTLGFYVDEVYPVKLRCYGCPELDPSKPDAGQKRIERVLPDAILERNFTGEELAQFPDQGWKWSELKRIDAKAGGATKAEVDALKLLAVFIQHSDSKPPQQRLACYSENLQWHESRLTCSMPVLMVQDLGATFGVGDAKVGAFSAMYYKGWERIDIWNSELEDRYLQENGRKVCFGRLTSAFQDGLFDPEISEEGRQFLSRLLNQLTDDQIRDLFRVARADQTKEVIVENGHETIVTIDHWLTAFKKKRDQINQRRCS